MWGSDRTQTLAGGVTLCDLLAPTLTVRRLLVLALLLGAERTGAQRSGAGATCDGNTVSAIEIHTHAPLAPDTSSVQGTLQRMERSRHKTTRPEVIAAYVRLARGRRCTELDRSESERLLRAQPFLASATVRTRADGPGRVRVEVETVDEVPILLGAGVRHGSISRLLLGNENYRGLGLTLALQYENGFHYRDGYGVRAVQYGAFGRPYTLAGAGAVHPLGETWSLELSHPLLTDLQYSGYHMGAGSASDYYRVVRPVGQDLGLYVRRMTYDFALLSRLNPIASGSPAGLLGAAIMGEDVRVGETPVVVTDTGLFPVPGAPVRDAGAPGTSVTRLAALGGFRAVRFVTAQGFDALDATQDIGRGAQLDALAGPSLSGFSLTRDVFLSGNVYLGAGDERSFLQFRAAAEGQTNAADSGPWHGVVMNGRLTWYERPSSSRTRTASVELSALRNLGFPIQLTFRDGEGGLRGHSVATFAGGTRAVARLEDRRVFRWFGAIADVALGGFVEAGQLWAGDVPYGSRSGVRGAAGLSVLGAYPSGGKRTYRVDFAVPFSRDGGAKFEVRFSSSDRTRMLWQEPGDVARARAGAVPANLLSWLPR